jgi:transcriptional regulator with XRE-family HTH domain
MAVQKRQWKVKRRLTDEQVARVRARPWARGSTMALARELGMSQSMISQIRSGYRYKRPEMTETYHARVTSGTERYSLGSFGTPEAAENAIAKFREQNPLRSGSIEKTKDGRYRARLGLGTFDTRWAAEREIRKAKSTLGQL